MNRLLRLVFVAFLVCITGTAFAQGGGIKGILKDEKGNPVVNANVEVRAGGPGGIISGRDLTNFDGEYTIKPLNGGNYSLKFSYLGKERSYTDISVAADQLVTVNGKLSTSNELKGATITTSRFVVPIINPENPGGRKTITSDVIEKTATRSAADLASLSTQVYQGKNGGGISIGGSRTTGTKYVIDGVQLNPGSTTFIDQAPNSVEAITTFSSGIPARYGDASGGLVSITTKGSSARTQGSIQYEHSLEGYNQNQLTGNLSGPLLRRTDSNGGKRVLIGYNVTADGVYSDDNSPVYNKSYYINDDVLARLQEHPLALAQTNGVTRTEYATQFIREGDLELRRRQPNVRYYRGQLAGKLDFNLTENVSVRVGGSYFANSRPNYDQDYRDYSLFSADNINRIYDQSGRGYIRFTQKFGNKAKEGELKDNTITNAYYTVQADYTKDYTTTQDPNKKHNTFDYGYVGKFEELFAPAFQAGGIDDSTGKVGIRLRGYTPVGVIFTPGTQNPTLTNYTKDFYAFNPYPKTLIDIQNGRGLRNGDVVPQTYSLFRNVGAAPTVWRQTNTDQVAVQIDASFDIKHKKTTHSVEFGLYYQQRNTKNYNVDGAAIWRLMRQFSNRVVNQEVDSRYATFIVGGKKYTWDQVKAGVVNPGPNDTILYERKFDSTAQGKFDRTLRDKLVKSGEISSYRDYISVDKYDPSFFSLDMFSADDLLNQGAATIGYYGYDYTGKPVTGQVNFNDFWTKKDADGYYTRPIGAYRPNYIAGYLSDYIQYKDFRITLGVRVERFDNNTKVLKDPYSLYAEKTANDVKSTTDVPANIGGDFIPYVGNNSIPNAAIIGYRNEDTWYDAAGREVADPRTLQASTGSDGLQPLLQKNNENIKDASFDPNASFTDYKPQVNAMPRINFSFPLNDNALFYAHYDIMYQRPNTGAYAVQTDYLFLAENPSKVYANSNLKPERAIDYEVGFQQRLNDNSGLTISGFYKERKDQIQIRPFIYAYPITYYAYGNRDYSTYKGLSLNYDLRRIGNLSMNINYTLSFTEGTGSSASSANGGNGNTVSGNSLINQLVSSGLPNLRTQFPLDIDSRHNINAQIDYRFRQGDGPTIGNSHVFENAGINLIFRARSGEPYTKYATAQNVQDGANNSPVINGAVNGSRLSGHYGIDLNIDKTIALNHTTTPEGRRLPGRLGLNIYAYAKNVFNIRDVTSVYGYTGRPDDDGYLTSPQGLTQIPSQVDPQSFIDLYRAASNAPDKIGAPRTILLGVRLSF